ncbi:MAG: 30S ribosome-binding factor RbfA [Myxococcota bacterium]
MNQRGVRVGRSIQAALGELLVRGDIKDPRVAGAGLISVTEVRVSDDLRHARVYVSIFAEEPKRGAALAGLRRAAGFLRREVGRALGIRAFPELDIRLDDSIEQGARIGGLLRDIKREE